MAARDVKVTWLGHGTWSLEGPGGVRVLVDPWLSNPRCPPDLQTPEADVIAVTHGHGDHIADVASVAARTGAAVLAPVELATWLGGQGVENVVGFNKGGTVEAEGVQFTMTAAVHTGGISPMDGSPGGYGGEPAGYVITFAGGYRVYASGDTAPFADMALIGEMYRPDLAILSIGDHYTMGPFGAAHAVRLLGVKEVLGGHWGTFDLLTGTPAALREEIAKLGLEGVTVHDLEPGGTLS